MWHMKCAKGFGLFPHDTLSLEKKEIVLVFHHCEYELDISLTLFKGRPLMYGRV